MKLLLCPLLFRYVLQYPDGAGGHTVPVPRHHLAEVVDPDEAAVGVHVTVFGGPPIGATLQEFAADMLYPFEVVRMDMLKPELADPVTLVGGNAKHGSQSIIGKIHATVGPRFVQSERRRLDGCRQENFGLRGSFGFFQHYKLLFRTESDGAGMHADREIRASQHIIPKYTIQRPFGAVTLPLNYNVSTLSRHESPAR